MSTKNKSNPRRPQSATNMWINTTGLASAVVSIVLIKLFGKQLSNYHVELVFVASFVLPIALLEVFFLKTPQRSTTGLDFSNPHPFDFNRSLIKLIGFYATLTLIALAYWIFPEYNKGVYNNYYYMLKHVIPVLAILVIPYFIILDRYMASPQDGYWNMGMLCLFYFNKVDRNKLKQHLLGWAVKGFFLALMYTYLSGNVQYLRKSNLSEILSSPHTFYEFCKNTLYAFDVLMAATGYMMTIRLLDSHIRSTESTLLGWGSALFCYEPFWNFFAGHYIIYSSDTSWEHWFTNNPVLYATWGGTILLLTGIYVCSTLPFGIRFSNLTHRGILTNGPYRYTRHPAYISKNLSWWLISMPFLSTENPAQAVKQCVMLLLLNAVYYIRAKTEERHLAYDPIYQAYSEYINEFGIFAKIKKYRKKSPGIR